MDEWVVTQTKEARDSLRKQKSTAPTD